MKTNIFLLRHAQTAWNKVGKVQGWTDIGLSKEGKEEARKIGEVFKDYSLQAIYSSPLKRAQQTAKEIAKHKNLPITLIEEFKEASFGIFEGMSFEEITVHPIFQEGLKKHGHFHFRPEKGESYKDLYKRVSQKLDEIVKKHKQEQIVIVAHGGVIRTIGFYLGIVSKENIRSFHIPNTQYFHFQYHHIEKKYFPIHFPAEIKKLK